VPAVGVEGGGCGGDGFEGGFGVDGQAGEAGVAAFGHQEGEGDAGFGEVGEPGVAELVEGPASGGGAEELGGSPVGVPGSPGVGVEVGEGGLAGGRGGDVGEEERSSLAAAEEPWEEPGGFGFPADEFGPASFADDHGASAGEVEVGDVEGQDFVGPAVS
jgi:hypothetical protein